MATLKEVARLAGVSASTVSRIINGKGEKCAGAAVQKRVWDAVRATGYVPNQEAKRLKEGGGAPKEAITVSCLFARAEDYKEDSFFNALAACVEEEVLRQGCRLGLRYSHKDALRLCREEAFAPGRTEGQTLLRHIQRCYDIPFTDHIPVFRIDTGNDSGRAEPEGTFPHRRKFSIGSKLPPECHPAENYSIHLIYLRCIFKSRGVLGLPAPACSASAPGEQQHRGHCRYGNPF